MIRIGLGLLLAGMLGCGTGPTPGGAPEADAEFVFGLLMVGPSNDHGWSQAHFEAGRYVEQKQPGTRMVYVDKVNPADRPGTTPAQLANDLVAQGARLLIFNSDDMKDGALEFARSHPEIPVIHISGDSAWPAGRNYARLPNLANIMGRMEHGAAMAGFAAAMTTRTGRIGYLGPLINDETRRLAAAVYLGARHAWTSVRKRKSEELAFKVSWIGFWFNVPGVTADPTQVADEFYSSGHDVVVSGIDTTEVLAEARKFSSPGKPVWAIPYDYVNACVEGEGICLGVPYYNWGPAYVRQVEAARAGTWRPAFEWLGPDWADINDPHRSAVGFRNGSALPPDAARELDAFIAALAGGLNLWTGPLRYQDGSPFLKPGEAATEPQIWYLPQLLEGMTGQSVSAR
jgi:simple sugar transport system substrate-binding protein